MISTLQSILLQPLENAVTIEKNRQKHFEEADAPCSTKIGLEDRWMTLKIRGGPVGDVVSQKNSTGAFRCSPQRKHLAIVRRVKRNIIIACLGISQFREVL